MKIRTWLLLSYLVVMLLPLLGAYGLFAWINSYHEERNVAEYMETFVELNELQAVLSEKGFYRTDADFEAVDGLASNRLAITLYASNGYMVHSTNPIKPNPIAFLPRKQLYEGFYEMRQTFGTVTYKEPVFDDGRIAGVYEIEWSREEWVAGVGKRTWFIGGLFGAFFLALYAVVVVLVGRKLNRPLRQLSGQMAAFAKGETVEPLQMKNDEIGALAGNFEAMREELTKANETLASEQRQKEFMIASISHDLKTPLTSIRAYAEAMEAETTDSQKLQEYPSVIVAKANHMRQMLDDLLTYTLLQSAAYQMERTLVDAEEFFDMLTSGYEMLCEERQINLHVTVDVEGEVLVNAKQLVRVVDNLMDNAIGHTERGGGICLFAVNAAAWAAGCFDFVKHALDRKDGVYLIVQNEGPGVSEETIRKAFDPLYQAEKARTKSGSGLGLAITKEIVEKHGGTVRMVSQDGSGTAVICWLPVNKGDDE